MKIRMDPIKTLVLQVYIPTTDHPDNEIDQIYDKIEEIINEKGHGTVNCLIMEDFNSIVGKGKEENIVDEYGSGKQNHWENMLMDFYKTITDIYFKNDSRRLYTWKSPGDKMRCQLDYMIVKQRFGNGIKDTTTLADPSIIIFL